MVNGFSKILTLIFGGVVAFSVLNGFLYSLGNIQRWDYMLANALLISVIYFAYLTYELYQIKGSINKLTQAKQKKK